MSRAYSNQRETEAPVAGGSDCKGSLFYLSTSAQDLCQLTETIVKITDAEMSAPSQPSPSPSPPPKMEVELEIQKAILPEVLFSLETLMAKSGQWKLGTKTTYPMNNGNSNHNSPGYQPGVPEDTIVSMDEVLETLRTAFNIDEDSFLKFRQEARCWKPAEFILTMTIVEADIKCQKSAKEPTNSYIRIKIGPTFKKEFNTPQIKGTKYPKWKHTIKIDVQNPNTDYILLELWHEKDDEKKRRRPFIKGSSQDPVKHVLLAERNLRVKEILPGGLSGWYDLENRFGSDMKDPARVLLSGSFSRVRAEAEGNVQEKYEMLFKCLVNHESRNHPKNKNQMSPCGVQKAEGFLSPASRAILSQYALILNLSPESQLLSWWSHVTVSLCPNDWQLLHTHFNNVISPLVRGIYSQEEQQQLKESISMVIDRCVRCIKHLEECFPVALPEQSRIQLTYMLQTMGIIKKHPKIRELLDEESICRLRDVIRAALQGFARQWWNKMADMLVQCSRTKSDQQMSTLTITDEVNLLLQSLHEFYDPIFKEGYDICCLKVCYQVIVKEMMETVGPVIADCCHSIPQSVELIGDDGIECDFLKGSYLMKIYKNLARIWKLKCPHLSSELVQDTGIQDFNSFFKEGFENQLSLTQDREKKHIQEVALNDDLQPIGQGTFLSSSLKEATAIPHLYKIWWFEFIWPCQNERAEHLMQVLMKVLSLSTIYCQSLTKRIDYVLQDSSKKLVNQRVCIVMNNIITIMNDLKNYPKTLGYNFMDSQTMEKYSIELEAMINISTLNIKNILQNFTLSVLEERKNILEKTIVKSCQESRESTFVTEILHPSIDILRQFLKVSTAKIFLESLWITVVNIMKKLVLKNANMEPSYYSRMLQVLRHIHMDLTPDLEGGLDAQAIETSDYTSLLEDLSLMEKSSSSLIYLFYEEQYKEQNQESFGSSTASLVIRTWFKDTSKLVVNVIMANNIIVPPDESHKAPLEYYVKVEVFSGENHYVSDKTPVLKEDPATFDKMFEFDLDPSTDVIEKGTVILTLKDRNVTRSDTFLGESVIPFADIAKKECDVRNTYLKMFLPDVSTGRRKILQVLDKRESDRVAATFFKRLKKAHPVMSDFLKNIQQWSPLCRQIGFSTILSATK